MYLHRCNVAPQKREAQMAQAPTNGQGPRAPSGKRPGGGRRVSLGSSCLPASLLRAGLPRRDKPDGGPTTIDPRPASFCVTSRAKKITRIEIGREQCPFPEKTRCAGVLHSIFLGDLFCETSFDDFQGEWNDVTVLFEFQLVAG